MAHEESRFHRSSSSLRIERIACVRPSPGNQRAPCHVGHEEGIPDEDGITDLIRHIRGRMAGSRNRCCGQLADLEDLAIGEQIIELFAAA